MTRKTLPGNTEGNIKRTLPKFSQERPRRRGRHASE